MKYMAFVKKKRGTFTAIGEATIWTQLAMCNLETVYHFFLDLRKAYSLINCKRVLRIMGKYRVGPNIRRYVSNIWGLQFFCVKPSRILQ